MPNEKNLFQKHNAEMPAVTFLKMFLAMMHFIHNRIHSDASGSIQTL